MMLSMAGCMLLVSSMINATSSAPQDGVLVAVTVEVIEGEGVGVRVVGVGVSVLVGIGTGVAVDGGAGTQGESAMRPHQVPQRPEPSTGGPTGAAAYS